MLSQLFHPIVWEWFSSRFPSPTEPQGLGWPSIFSGRHTLIAAPTGSGKTLTGFLAAIDDLLRQALDGSLSEGVQVVYVSPLKALSNDIHRNLQTPLAEIQARALAAGHLFPSLSASLRTGDTPAGERESMRKHPPHILVTTPESLFLLLTSPKSREMLRTAKTVIVDEIHALARDKRGAHLSLSLARLDHLCGRTLQRIGLSATQKPLDEIARFLVGQEGGKPRECEVIDSGHLRTLDMDVDLPPTELSSVCSNETWEQIYDRLVGLIQSHRSTLIFVNTRRMAERLSWRLTERLGPEAVASHHGSLSKEIRLSAEERLKAGQLKAIVATASLELGIDVGYIDLVCQIGSPRSVAAFLQRVGRSGHAVGALPKGRLFPLTRDDLMEALALIRAVRHGRLDRIEIPEKPLDILAQQLTAACAAEEWDEDALFDLARRASPYRNLTHLDFESVLNMLVQGADPKSHRGAYLHRDKLHHKIRARRGAGLAAITSGGAIPDTADYRVVTPDGIFVGTVNEDFALESQGGDVFLLGTSSWRIRHVRGGEVTVEDAHGAPATVPFWLGEAPGRTVELSGEISTLREELEAKLTKESDANVSSWLAQECRVTPEGARQAVLYARAQMQALGFIPTQKRVVFERFFDETGGMQLVIHAPFGTRINRAWGLALRKNFCRTFDFELQAAADDNGINLSLGPQHSFEIQSLFKMIRPDNALAVLTQALLAVPMFRIRWRWNATRSLAVLRFKGGTKVPPPLQRFHSDDLLTAVFPAQTACLENRPGDIPVPDHPLVRQTLHDCLNEAMDVTRWIQVLEDVKSGVVTLEARDTREPSPFCYELLNANPYAFLDDAPLEERRARAVATRRTLPLEDLKDLGRLDGEAIDRVRREAWPLVRDKDELHDVLMDLGFLWEEEAKGWQRWFEELILDGRALRVVQGSRVLWVSTENWPQNKPLPEILRGRMAVSGPTTVTALAHTLDMEESTIQAGLEALEGEGTVIRGQFSASSPPEKEWCDRRLLARIHRLTLQGLRKQVQPVPRETFWRFLFDFQGANPSHQKEGRQGLLDVLWQLQGLEIPAGLWESDILAARLKNYAPFWLDDLSYSGEIAWGRLSPPTRDQESPWSGSLNRVVPIALVYREELGWLLPVEKVGPEGLLRENARAVLEVLQKQGALFWNDLQDKTRLLPSQVEEALSELASLGLVSADGFSAIRLLVTPGLKRRINAQRRRRPTLVPRPNLRGGRWSLFPSSSPEQRATRDERLEAWAWQLLQRYGVVFRDLLARETAAPSWHELVPAYRKLELRGEIRGGRFVDQVSGEQYALAEAVDPLRRTRDQGPTNQWTVVSAADPLNLTGVLNSSARVPASQANRLLLKDAQVMAASLGGEIRFFEELPKTLREPAERALKLSEATQLRREILEELTLHRV